MRKCIDILAVALTFSLAACEGEALLGMGKKGEALCEAGDVRCKIGQVSCVVGYDGDCSPEQVCYAGEGAPKGRMGFCTEGQFDAKGKLVAAVLLRGFEQGTRWVWPAPGDFFQGRECFLGCPPVGELFPVPRWKGFGKAPATLEVYVVGPDAQTEQLHMSARGREQNFCKAEGGGDVEWQLWQCKLPEGWAGLNTREPLELKLWTESSKDFPWTGSFAVDTQPLELVLEAQFKESLLEVSVNKRGVPRKENGAVAEAWLEEISYFRLEVIRTGIETLLLVDAEEQVAQPHSSQADYRIEFLGLQPGDMFQIHAMVSAKDIAGNEVSMEKLSTKLMF